MKEVKMARKDISNEWDHGWLRSVIYPAFLRARISQKVGYEWKYAGKEMHDLKVYWFVQHLGDKSKNLPFVFGFILRGINYIQHNICPFNYLNCIINGVKYICCVIIQLLPLFIYRTFSFFQTGALCPLNSYSYSPSPKPLASSLLLSVCMNSFGF